MSSFRPRSKKFKLEELEARLAPANDLFQPPAGDAAGSPVQVRFEWDASKAAFKNEIGIYAIDDAQGRVGGLLPTDAGYAGQALLRGTSVFQSGARQGAKNTLTLSPGQLFGVYLVSNGTTQQALAGQRFAFFSFDAANADGVDHVRAGLRGDGGQQFRFEDTFGGGDRDYNDAVISASRTHVITTPGLVGQSVQANFQRVSRQAGYQNEVGLVRVDDLDGRIGTLRPGDPGYAQAALSSPTRQVIFSDTTMPGVTFRTLTLDAGAHYVYYVVANGTAQQFLAGNPTNTAGTGPLAYFSFATANPDGQEHLDWRAQNECGFEDLPGLGDADFNDMVIRYGFGAPQGTAANPQPGAPTISDVANQTTNEDTGTPAIAFTVGDDFTAPALLRVTAVSSNPTLVPNANIVLGGSGASRTVSITPAPDQNGTVTITLGVSDGTQTTTDTFTLTVNPINDPPTFTASNPPTAPFSATAQQQTVAGFATFTAGPPDESGQTATYTVTNVTNSGLFATLPSVAPNGTLTYTPVAGGFGSSQFTVTARDSGGTANGGADTSAPQTFTITVSPTQGAPATINGTDGNMISLNDPAWQTTPTLLSDANPSAGSVPDGTRILDVTPGSGPAVQRGQQVSVFYKGYLLDGTVFDMRQPPSAPAQFLAATGVPGGVIPGFAAGLVGMQVGGTRRIDISSYLAYGNSPPSGIPANSRLVFEVTVVSIP